MKKQQYLNIGNLKDFAKRHTSVENLLRWSAIYGIFLASIFGVKTATISAQSTTHDFLVGRASAATVQLTGLTNLVTISQTPTPTPVQPFDKRLYILSQKHGDILLRIWTNESGRGNLDGLAGYCASKGLSNEFGYDPQEYYCFDSFKYSVQIVNNWFETCLQQNSLSSCLLEYSGNSDTYIGKFLSQSNN